MCLKINTDNRQQQKNIYNIIFIFMHKVSFRRPKGMKSSRLSLALNFSLYSVDCYLRSSVPFHHYRYLQAIPFSLKASS